MKKWILCVFMCLTVLCYTYSQTDTSFKKDSIKKEVPQAILDLVKEYDRQIKEAEQKRKQQLVKPPVLEIDGIVMDETMSKSGREFYELFFSFWQKPVGYKNYYIKIKEKPFQLNNTVIEVYLKDRLLYQQMMRRRYDEVEEMARAAVVVVQRQMYKELVAQRAILEQQQRLNNQGK